MDKEREDVHNFNLKLPRVRSSIGKTICMYFDKFYSKEVGTDNNPLSYVGNLFYENKY